MKPIKRRSFLKGLVAAVTGAAVSEAVSTDIKYAHEKIFSDLETRKTQISLLNGRKELSGNGYARAEVSGEDWDIQDGKMYNNKQIEFPKAEHGWGQITGFICADEKGNTLFYGGFNIPKEICAGEIAAFCPGDISLEI